jgi:signal transduction histidine kinase
MMELLDDVVTLGQSEEWEIEFKPTALDLGAFCQGLEDELRIIAGTNIELIFIPPKEIDYILLADEKLLRQTITNLLSNAIKYSPDGGTVALECSHDDQHTIIRVSDEGIGIPDKDQEHLFDAFHRASNVRDLPGTGLGLTIAKQAINLHGGTIAVESEVGKGTTFTVTIPKT